MDEYRSRYEAQQREREAPPHHAHHLHEEAPPPILPIEPVPAKGLLSQFGIGGDGFEDYLPIILILLGAVGVYLWLGKSGGGLGGLGGLLGGFLK